MAGIFVSRSVRPVFETMEGRTLMSGTPPVFGQFPPIILSKEYGGKSKSESAPTPPPVKSAFPPPILSEKVGAPAEPVQPVLDEAPEGLKTIASRRRGIICVSWKSVAASAETTVVEYATDGKTFATLAMLDADQKKHPAKQLDKDETYTFRVYTLDANGHASSSAEVTASWICRK